MRCAKIERDDRENGEDPERGAQPVEARGYAAETVPVSSSVPLRPERSIVPVRASYPTRRPASSTRAIRSPAGSRNRSRTEASVGDEGRHTVTWTSSSSRSIE